MTNLERFVIKYQHRYQDGMYSIKISDLQKAIDLIESCKGNIFVGGNGGSAAISNHLCCDFIKGADLKAHSMSCNTPLITAIANDMSYADTLSYQIEKLHSDNDLVILISSSGNSQNIIRAADTAKKFKIPVIGLSGFSGGKLKEIADVSLHINVDNYGVVEDCHQSIMHIISQYIRHKKES